MNGFSENFFPPRKMLVVYEEYDPTDFIRKLNTRKDKYKVEQKLMCRLD